MWSSSFAACLVVAVVGAMAMNQHPALPMHNAMFGIPPQRVGDHEHPEPCKFPPYFTFDQVDIVTSAYDGSLLVVYVNFEGAYDDIAKKYAVETVVDFFNGTKLSAKLIEDYREGKQYIIYTNEEREVVCAVVDIEGKRFPQEYFIPADATYLTSATIGDRDVVVDSWLETSRDGTVHTVKTVTRGECVPVGFVRRHFHPETGEQIGVVENRLYNFKLGICDPEDYFRIPEECKQGKALTKPDEVMQKLLENLRM